MPLLEVTHLHKSFGGVHAINGVSFNLEAGEIVALIGPNGAGKSTTFNVLNGQLLPDSGAVCFQGESVTGLSPPSLWRCGIGRTFQTAQVFHSLSVVENIQMALLSHHQALSGLRSFVSVASAHQVEAALQLAMQVGLAAHSRRCAGTLSYADIKRVELAMALAASPTLLLMDEPTAGMAMAERHALMDLVSHLVQARGMTVLFTEHSMDVVFAHAKRILVMAQGKLIANEAPAAIQTNATVQALYLGTAPP